MKKETVDTGSEARRLARRLIDEHIHFYNHQRIQLKTKLTPQEKRSRFVS